jgi:hypothetical protein
LRGSKRIEELNRQDARIAKEGERKREGKDERIINNSGKLLIIALFDLNSPFSITSWRLGGSILR